MTRLGGSVSAGYTNAVVTFAEACGVSRAQLLRTAGLDDSALDDPEARLPLHALRMVFDAAAHLTNDPAFALRFGVGVRCSQLTLASALAAAAPPSPDGSAGASSDSSLTLREALDGLNRYVTLSIEFGAHEPPPRYRFVEEPLGVWLEDLRPAIGAHAWPSLTESVFARFATGVRRRGGEGIVRALEVTHAAPADARHREAYDAVFRVPVTFGASRNALCLDPTFLERPLEPLAAPVQAVLTRHADRELQRLRRSVSWSERVSALLVATLQRGDRDGTALGVVCRELAVSRQTLHRRLREEQTTFVALHDQARRAVADELLCTGGLTIDAVASRVGYSEAAAFSRAYKRWTGRRPSEVMRTR